VRRSNIVGFVAPSVELEVDDRTVRITNPDRVYFPARRETKLDLVNYYLSVGDGIVRALRERPCMLHRFPTGVTGDKVHQKRLPAGAPDWIQTVRVDFPRFGRHAHELCVTHLADVIWAVQMSTVEFHPWNSRRVDTEKPDEWRIDLDPGPAAGFEDVRTVAAVVHEVLSEIGAVGWPKTSGGKGMHVYVRIPQRWGFPDVRNAAWAFALEIERRLPDVVDLSWWRKDRDPTTVFVDYNQNTRDHTLRSAYSVRGVAEAPVSAPLTWNEVSSADPRDFTLATMPARFAEVGDLHAGIDEAVFALDPLLEWAERDGLESRPTPATSSRTTPDWGPGGGGRRPRGPRRE
jgi:DNA ligase D